jgi:hypothetical protein
MKAVTLVFFAVLCIGTLIYLKPAVKEAKDSSAKSPASIVNANPMKANMEQYKRIQPILYTKGN